jgi:hypothetical protein
LPLTAVPGCLHLKEFDAMKAYPALLFVAALGGCAAGPSPEFRNFQPKIANPSAIIAAEIGFNQLAQEKGQWTAFRQTAAKDAMMFVPQPVSALEYLKGKADPAQSVKWQPSNAFMSCDGKTGVTTGAWQRGDGSVGYFTTVWQFVETNAAGDGEWKWVLYHGDTLTAPRASKEMIETKVASCKGSASGSLVAPSEGAVMKAGYARDQSLSYTWVVQPNGARTVEVKLWNGTVSETVISNQVAAPN